MTLAHRLAEALADRIHARGDAAAQAQGLTVQRLPGGRRRISHPALPALLGARRRHALSHGLDAVDRALMDPATAHALRRTHRRLARTSGPPASPADLGFGSSRDPDNGTPAAPAPAGVDLIFLTGRTRPGAR